MNWIKTNGGPFLLTDRSRLDTWSGANLDLDHDDYERACEIEESVGKVAVGDGWGLVLAGPLSTSFVPLSDDRGILIRINYAPDRQSVERHLHDIRQTRPSAVRDVQIDFQTPNPILFDAAFPGYELAVMNPVALRFALNIELDLGTYDVCTSEYSPDPEIGLVLHYLIRN